MTVLPPTNPTAPTSHTRRCAPRRRSVLSWAWALALATAGALTTPAQAAGGFLSTQPTPRVEHWQNRRSAIEQELQDSTRMAATRSVFVGDSITDFWLYDDNAWVSGQKYGRQVWNENFAGGTPPNLALNIGISGDRTEHLLHRIKPRAAGGLGHLDAVGLRPELLVVMLGINNTWAAESPVADSVFEGVRAVLVAVHERQPQARIVLQSILPTNDPVKNREVVEVVNQRLQALARRPDWSKFTDGLHPNQTGYRIWRDRLLPFLATERHKASAATPAKEATSIPGKGRV